MRQKDVTDLVTQLLQAGDWVSLKSIKEAIPYPDADTTTQIHNALGTLRLEKDLSPQGTRVRLKRDWAAQALDKAYARTGRAWDLLGPDLRRALVSHEFLQILLSESHHLEHIPILAEIAESVLEAYAEIENENHPLFGNGTLLDFEGEGSK